MLSNDLIAACLKHAEEDLKLKGSVRTQNEMGNLLIKVVQLEQFTQNDIRNYLYKLCNNQMTMPTIEVLLAIMRIYASERLPQIPHINNPQAFAVIKDLEDFLLQKITDILLDNKENLIINESKIHIVSKYLRKKYCGFYSKLCKIFK